MDRWNNRPSLGYVLAVPYKSVSMTRQPSFLGLNIPELMDAAAAGAVIAKAAKGARIEKLYMAFIVAWVDRMVHTRFSVWDC